LTSDLTVPTLAINIKANNISLDLNGHTVIYDTQLPTVVGTVWTDYAYNESATFGIRLGLWNYVNTTILNGIIKQGPNCGTGFLGVGFSPIFLNHAGIGSRNEIAGLTLYYYGDSITGLVSGEGKVHHNVIIDGGN
jgi:hypothetical protein